MEGLLNISVLLLILLTLQGSYSDRCVNGRGGGCELYCHESNTTVTCSCGSLGVLEANNKTCHIKPRLIYSHGNDFILADEEKNNEIPIVKWKNIFSGEIVRLIAQDYSHDRIFYGSLSYTTSKNTLGYIRVRNRAIYVIKEYEENINGLTYDNYNKDVYISMKNKIHAINNYDSPITLRSRVLTTFQFNVGQLQVDSVSRLLFAIVNKRNITRVNLTDDSFINLFSQPINGIVSITLDIVSEKIFWIANENNGDKIEMSNYDGTCRKLLQQLNSQIPFSITYWNGTLFWSDNGKQIYKTQIVDGETHSYGIALQYNIHALEFYGKTDFNGVWSSWAESNKEKNVYHRTCIRSNIWYYSDEKCLSNTSQLKVNSFVCPGSNRKKIEPLADKDKSEVSTSAIIGVCFGTFALLVLVLVIVRVCYNSKIRNPTHTSNPPPFQRQTPLQHEIDFGVYQTGLNHHYEDISELQQQLKEKALKEHMPVENTASNAYLDPATLRVHIPPRKSESEGAYAIDPMENEEQVERYLDNNKQASTEGFENQPLPSPPVSDIDYVNMIERSRLSF